MTVDSEPNNNSSKLLPSSPKPLIHVLCCPSCPYMCLQESVLIDHVTGAHPEPPSADAGAESVNQLKLYRCKLCDSVSTQKCLMLEHAAVFHGAESRQQEDDLLVVRDLKLPGNYGAPAGQEQKMQDSALKQQASPSIATGSRKRKLTVPEKLPTDPSQGPETLAISSGLYLPFKLWEAARLTQQQQQQQQHLHHQLLTSAAAVTAVTGAPLHSLSFNGATAMQLGAATPSAL
uniref:C2H2-type domain-containing protein n=1 Tax=Macrostomum lignano TaxID=282301 RepID=A0A1I8H3Y9_9PLAT